MNSQLTLQDLAGALAESAGKDRLTAELFLREFTSLLQESLSNGEVVNIEGLGTWGVDVSENPAEQTITRRLYFRPDEKFREQVNKPFSFFEKVEIAEGVSFHEMEVVEGFEKDMYESSREFVVSVPVEQTQESEKQEVVMAEEIKSEEKPLQEEPQENAVQENQIEKEQTADNAAPSNEADAETEMVQEEPQEKTEAASQPQEKEVVVVDLKKEEPVKEKRHHKSHRSSHRRHKKHNWSKVLMGILGIVLVVGFIGTVILLPRYQRMRRIAEAREYYIVNSADTASQQRTPATAVKGQQAPEQAAPADRKENKQPAPEKKEAVKKQPEAVKEKPEVAEEKKAAPQKSGAKVIDTIKIKSGDLMTQLSLKYYGHKYFWVYIYLFNKDNIKDPNNVPIGTQLRIPAPEVYGIDSKNAASKKKAAALQSRILKGENINPSEIN